MTQHLICQRCEDDAFEMVDIHQDNHSLRLCDLCAIYEGWHVKSVGGSFVVAHTCRARVSGRAPFDTILLPLVANDDGLLHEAVCSDCDALFYS